MIKYFCKLTHSSRPEGKPFLRLHLVCLKFLASQKCKHPPLVPCVLECIQGAQTAWLNVCILNSKNVNCFLFFFLNVLCRHQVHRNFFLAFGQVQDKQKLIPILSSVYMSDTFQ